MTKFFPFLMVLGIALSCSGNNPKKPKKRPLAYEPVLQRSQVVEGRLEFVEKLLVLGGNAKTVRHLKISLSGKRQHLNNDKLLIKDQLVLNSVLKENNMKNPEKYLGKIEIINDLFKPEPNAIKIKYPNSDHYKLNKLLKTMYKFSHFLPPKKYRKILQKGMYWEQSDTITRVLKGQPVQMVRKFEFKVKDVIHKNNLHLAQIQGNFISSSKNKIKIGGFTVELVGRGVMETEFQMDTGTWNKIKAREILGWAGTFKNKFNQDVTAGYKQELKLNLHFTVGSDHNQTWVQK